MNVMLGQVVCSKAGRDEGRIFIISGIVDDKYVFVSDGDLRRFENPKKKKIKHLDITSIIIESLTKKLNDSIKVTNAEIRKALAEVKEKSESGE
ncbi:50S ribosomal protein L14e [Ruminiclostridium hungatei]|uniref:50S ribosomal protein L14e n=1 Tax=Ruminiclostridium hungatei TaxID=48256 RepID=A0A1V4SHL9_RUMHU|nr:KOW domain-containing RNA-binding protein [Ruminiclostridium hungatei]OPX42996.1 50S ribosomal protein L14e [Ruminiclostridium hungatei]